MGLEESPDEKYNMSVIEFAGRCTQALGVQGDIENIEKDCHTWMLADAAAQAATTRPDAGNLALATGFYFEEIPQNDRLFLWFRCLFWTYFDRRYSPTSPFPACDDIAGWARVLGLPDYAGLAMLKDKRAINSDQQFDIDLDQQFDTAFDRLFDAAMALYKWFILPATETDTELDEVPIPVLEAAGETI